MKQEKCYACGRTAKEVQGFVAAAVHSNMETIKREIAELMTKETNWIESIRAELEATVEPVEATSDSVRALMWRTAKSDPGVLGAEYPYTKVEQALKKAKMPIQPTDSIRDVLNKLQRAMGQTIIHQAIRQRIADKEAEIHAIENDASPDNHSRAFVEFDLPLRDAYSPVRVGSMKVTLCRICAGLRDRDMRAEAQRRADEDFYAME